MFLLADVVCIVPSAAVARLFRMPVFKQEMTSISRRSRGDNARSRQAIDT